MYVLEQLSCDNESQFVCKLLNSMYGSLSVEFIRNKAMEIADSQLIISKEEVHHNINILNNNIMIDYQNYPVILLIILDHFKKKEGIEFGYFNKQLFIETQKYSYLSKRNSNSIVTNWNDCANMRDLIIRMVRLCLGERGVNLKYNQAPKEEYFDNFFRGLVSLDCYDITWMFYIPIEILFIS